MEKPLETATVNPKFGYARAERNHQAGAYSVMESQMRCLPAVSVGEGTMASASISVQEKAAPKLLP